MSASPSRHKATDKSPNVDDITAMSAWATQVRVGTASWSEPEFVRAGWYPPGLAAGQRLAYYAQHFDLVELNSSFYALPQARQCERWVKETPPGFLFDAKIHRLLSRHATRPDALPADLRDQVEVTDRGNVVLTPMLEEEMAGRLLEALEPLERAGKLGALLLQLTPSFAPRACDLGQLEALLRLLRGKGNAARQIVVELRNRGWLEGARRQETAAFFREQGVTLASIDGPPSEGEKHPAIMPAVDEITDERLTYLRLHGRDPKAYLTGRTVAERFCYDYTDGELDEVLSRAERLASSSDAVHVVFNNNARDFAPKAAERLRRRLGQVTAAPAVVSTVRKPSGPLKQGMLF